VHQAPPRSRGPRRGLSFFGSAGVVLGGLGIAALYVPHAADFARPLAMAGLAAAGFGLLVAVLFGHSGKAMPVFGLLVSAAAWGMWLKNTGQLPDEIKKVQATVANGIADIKLPTTTTPDTGAAKPAPKPAPAKPTAEPAKQDTSVFNFDKDAAAQQAAQPTQPHTVVELAPTDLATARQNLETARLAAASQMNIDYASARSKAEDAWAALQTARANYAAGSPELTAANQKWLDAKAVLDAIARRLRADPAVAAAEKAVPH
jgi:hypothetical protein